MELTTATYAELVLRYSLGEFVDAARDLAKASETDIESAAIAYRQRPITDTNIKAAIMLHTEILMRTSVETPFHMRMARDWMGELPSSRHRSFEQLWYLTLCSHYVRALSPAAESTLVAAARAFPDNPEIRMALGSYYEMAGWWQKDRSFLKEAESAYRRLLETQPDTAEVVVRLGRVLALMGQETEALALLKRGLEITDEPRLELAAHLSLGDLYRKREELSRAIESYETALDLDFRCQVAMVALALALHRAGDADGSLEVIKDYLRAEEVSRPTVIALFRKEHDLWWRYVLGNSDRFDSHRARLRAMVVR
jgi:tetratricopeptide (TPR) repeat protein